MSNDDFTPLLNMALTTDEEIRAYIHPTRMTILANLAAEQQTVTGIARQLGVHPANLTHHFKLLEKVGLIKLVEKRDTGKNLEKYYRAVAYNFSVSQEDETPANKQALALSILRDNLSAAEKMLKIRGSEDPVWAILLSARLQPEQIEAFAQKLEVLLTEFEALDSDTGKPFTLSFALYPSEVENQPDQEVLI